MRKINGYIRIFIYIAMAAIVSSAAMAQAQFTRIHEIKRPLFSVPAIVKAGELLPVAIVSKDLKSADSFTLSLTDETGASHIIELGEWNEILTVDEKQNGTVRIPPDSPEGLYDLTVTFGDGTIDTQPHSVKVVKDFKKDFDFIQFTDIHFNLERVPNEARIKLLKDISALNPEFILFTGDTGLNPDRYNVDYPMCYQSFLDNLKEPVFMVPGNHEQYIDSRVKDAPAGPDAWAAMFGPTYFSFDYGNMHFTGINTFDWDRRMIDLGDPDVQKMRLDDHAAIGAAQWEWLKNDITTAKNEGKNITAFTHIPVEFLMGGQRATAAGKSIKIEGPSYQQFTKLLKTNGVSYLLIGHMHMNSMRKLNDVTTEVLTMGAGTFVPGGGVKEWGFRIVHVRDGKIAGFDIKKYAP